MYVHVRDRVDFSGLQRDLDQIFHSVFSDWTVPVRGDGGVDVQRDADGVTLTAEVPGIDPAALKVDVDGHTLTISGERQRGERHQGVYHLRERRAGDFSSTFRINDRLDADAVTAEYRHGVLTVRIPKRAAAKARQIDVASS